MKKIALAILLIPYLALADGSVELRGAKLGMTLTDLRQMQWPDTDLKSVYQEQPVIVCSDDGVPEYSYIKTTSPFELKCTWMQPFDSGGKHKYTKAYLTVGKAKAATTEYTFFRNDIQSEFVLVNIRVFMSNNTYDYLVSAISEKYGSPTKVDSKEVQNRMGASFDSKETSWSIGENMIYLYQRFMRVDEMYLTYMNSTLMENYIKMKKESEPAPKL